MREGQQNDDSTGADGTGPPPPADALHRKVSVPVIVIVLVIAIGATVGYVLAHGKKPTSLATPKPSVSATPSSPASQTSPSQTTPPSSPTPSAASATTGVAISMGAACEWAYSGQSDGKFSGSDYSIVCLGTNGQVLGGFNGTHSLNAWCAEPQHTDGRTLPDPALAKGTWTCTGSGSASRPTAAATAPAPATSQPTQASRPSSSVSVPGAVPIPMGAACEWAYPGQSDGKFSGSDYSIVCLGTNGQVLGGFNGTHSLNAWCAEPQHTDGKSLPSPALVNGEWLCTA
jgi:hypothetical protein